MIACDCCKDVTRTASEYRVLLSKVNVGAQRTTRSEIKAGAVELCEHCIDQIWAKIVTALPVNVPVKDAQ